MTEAAEIQLGRRNKGKEELRNLCLLVLANKISR